MPAIPVKLVKYPTPGRDALGTVARPHPLRKPSPAKQAPTATRPVKAPNY